jgi:AraC-like DNA-binding protein
MIGAPLLDHSSMLGVLDSLPPCDLPTLLASVQALAPLLDTLADVVFFIKDSQARYVFVNRTLSQRCGYRHAHELLGLTADQVFAEHFGRLYSEQDHKVLSTGRGLADQLELHLYLGNQPVWCLTHKLSLRDAQGRVIGLAGISRDLQSPQAHHPAFPKVAAVDAHIRAHFQRPISLAELTAVAGLSAAQLERQCKRIFQLTPRQMIHKARLEEASRLLRDESLPITEIALRCGYTDHSAFSRQFRALTQLSPSQYREANRPT